MAADRNSESSSAFIYNLFPENFGELDCSVSSNYLDSLSSTGINAISHEPERLKNEYEQMTLQTQLLAFQNYQTFITAAECSKEIYKDFNIIDKNLSSLLQSIPRFATKIDGFSKSSKETNARRKQNFLVLSRHTQILEILEIPQLMDTCVRNNYYDEAIELINYVKRLEKKLSSVKIIMHISKDVKKATNLMLEQLLLQLKGSIQLPACLRIIGYLRQLESFTEAELRIKFLQARNSWFNSLVKAIPDKEAYYHLTKIIETSRIHLFDIVTQYRAIFSEDEPLFVTDGDKDTNYSNILHAWIGRKITEFILSLEVDLRKGVGSRLDAVISQCMYFGLSFGRVGSDFRSLLIPVFNKHVTSTFVHKLHFSTKCFEDSLATFSLSHGIKSFQKYSNSSQQNVVSDTSLAPPHQLLDFPPLAVCTNSILLCFNEFRSFASFALAKSIQKILQDSLDRIIIAIIKWYRLETQTRAKKTKIDEDHLILLTIRDFLPYIDRCFNAIFSPTTLSIIFNCNPGSHVSDISSKALTKLTEELPEFQQQTIEKSLVQRVDMKTNSEEGEGHDAVERMKTDSLTEEEQLKSIEQISLDGIDETKATSPAT
eukprot:gene11097-12266_t